MKKFTYKDYWFTRNFFNLLIIPVTILSIIIGLYGDVIPQDLSSMKIIKHFANFFEIQSVLATKIPVQKIVIEEEKHIDYVHLLVLDRTSSTLNIDDKSVKSLCDSLRNAIRTDFSESNASDFTSATIKQLVIGYYYHNIRSFNNVSELCPTYYDGDGGGLKPLLTEALKRPELNWFACKKESNRIFLTKNLADSLVIIFKNQKTDFVKILEGVPKYSKFANPNMIVTIISDFDNEGQNIGHNDINKFQSQNNISQLNLIYLPPTDPLKRKKSAKLISLFRSHFEKTSNYLELNLENFNDTLFNNESFEQYKYIIKQSLSSFIYNDSNIVLYHPKQQEKGLTVAQCKLTSKLLNSKKTGAWRISSAFPSINSERAIGSYKINSISNKCSFDVDGSWYSFPQKGDTLILEFISLPNLESTNLFLDVFNGEETIRYGMRFRKVMPLITANIGKLSMFLLLLIFYSLIVFHLWRTIETYCENLLFNDKKTIIKYYQKELVNIFFLSIFLCLSFFVGTFFIPKIVIGIFAGLLLICNLYLVLRFLHKSGKKDEKN